MRKLRVVFAVETLRLQQLIHRILVRTDADIINWTKEMTDLGLPDPKPPNLVVIAFENKGYFEKTYTAVSLSYQILPRILCIADGELIERELRRYQNCQWLPLPKDAPESREAFQMQLLSRLEPETDPSFKNRMENPLSRFLVGIGCSAGGPRALLTVLGSLPTDTCAILVVQHLTSGFSGRFAEYMDRQCMMKVTEAQSGALARDGTIYLASDGCQLSAASWGDGFILKNAPGKKVNGFAPSVDYLFSSLAQAAGRRAMGVILTGMGDDGARGLLKMRQAGAYTIAQDRETSELYSMPNSAVTYGGTDEQVPLYGVADEIIQFCRRMRET